MYAFVFDKIKNSAPETTAAKNCSCFGAILFLVAGIPSVLSIYPLINLPMGPLASWTISGFIIHVPGGTATAKIVK